MDTNFRITRIYQWVSEAIAIYFLLLPLFYILKFPPPLWSYLFIMVSGLIGFIVAERYWKVLGPILLIMLAITTTAYWVFHYPLMIAAILGILFGWRYIAHQTEADHQNQLLVLILTILPAIIFLFVDYQVNLLVMVLLQFIILVIGSYLSAMLATKESSQLHSNKVIFIFFSILVAVILFLFPLYPVIRALYEQLTRIPIALFKLVVVAIAGLLDLISQLTGRDLNFIEASGGLENDVKLGDGDLKTEEMEPYDDTFITIVHWSFWGLVALAGIILVIFLFRKYIQKDVELRAETQREVTTLKDTEQPDFRRSVKTKKPDHPVRKSVFDFEKFARRKGIGRTKGETIWEWFHRLGFDVSPEFVSVYNRVRYGEKEITDEEVDGFKTTLQEAKKKVKDLEQ
ncbi:hypothetical protein RZN25_16160 [Bacillaceae bacterium S4-13-56]